MLGLESGQYSYISLNDVVVESKHHDQADYQTLINNFYVTITDGKVSVKSLIRNQFFIKFEDNEIVKKNLQNMLVSQFNEETGVNENHSLRIGKFLISD